MEWFLGAVIGFIFGLFGAEFRAQRERQQRKRDYAESLYTEISGSRETLAVAETGVTTAESAGRVARHAVGPFMRDVFQGCVGDLALLPDDTRRAVLEFYTGLTSLEFIVNEGYLKETLYRVTETAQVDENEAIQQKMWLQTQFKIRTVKAREAADKALTELKKIAVQPVHWWQRIVGR